MRTFIAASAALLSAVAVPAQAQSLGSIVNSVLGGGYNNSYQQPYGYQPSYGYTQPSYGYGYQTPYTYQRTYSYQQPSRYTRSYTNYGYNPYQQGYAYSRGRSYEQRHHGRGHHRHENDDNQD